MQNQWIGDLKEDISEDFQAVQSLNTMPRQVIETIQAVSRQQENMLAGLSIDLNELQAIEDMMKEFNI
jgi:hypothetical protein